MGAQSALRVVSGPPNPASAFRVSEFTADPAVVDLSQVSGEQVRLVVFGMPGHAYHVESSLGLDQPGIGWEAWGKPGR